MQLGSLEKNLILSPDTYFCTYIGVTYTWCEIFKGEVKSFSLASAHRIYLLDNVCMYIS